MKVLSNITLQYETEELIRFCHLNRIDDRIGDIESIIDEGYRLLDPRAIYKVAKIVEVKEDQLILEGGEIFESKLLAEKFKCAHEIAVYVLTIGPALERRVTELGTSELHKSFIMDCVGTYALRQVFDLMKKDYRPNGTERISKFSPCSTAYWDITQQKVIFRILGADTVERVTGVRLNDFCIMIPRKSMSGVMGDTEKQFHECEICKIRCEYRRAPFKGRK